MNVKAETIHTPRLELRMMGPEHADDVWSIWGDIEMGKYLADEYYTSPEVLRELFGDVEEWPDYAYVAYARDTGAFIGTCSVGPEGDDGEWGFGYTVTKAHWGEGYATEMAKAMMDWARRQGIRAFRCEVAVENEASGRVMEKCGLHVDHESSFAKRGTDIVYRSHVYKGMVD